MLHGIHRSQVVPSKTAVLLGGSEQPALAFQNVSLDAEAAFVQQCNGALSVWISSLRVWPSHPHDGFVFFTREGVQNWFGLVFIDHAN